MTSLSLWWAAPFAGILLSIALGPLLTPRVWHGHYGKIGLFWATAFMIPWGVLQGGHTLSQDLIHTLALDYLPFVSLIAALFSITGGLYLRSQWLGTPRSNLTVLLSGSLLASWVGTTGAAMVLIRPLIRANSWRRHSVHTKVFFIFMVANIGGALSPLGDPPLFMGYLNGVRFFWTTQYLFLPMAFMIGSLGLLYYGIDYYFFSKETQQLPVVAKRFDKLKLMGGHNIFFLAGVVLVIFWSGQAPDLGHMVLDGVPIPRINLVREGSLWVLCLGSFLTTDKKIRQHNHFTWGPFLEVAKLFFAIFVTLIPVIKMLQQGKEGALGPLIVMVTDVQGNAIPLMYYWMTGLLSSFLDNAPTYVVYFFAAGGDADFLMGQGYRTLMAISCGAVFMGAITYIGNAPNFMIKAIAEERGMKMPSFFGYMAWSCCILVPLLALVGWLFL